MPYGKGLYYILLFNLSVESQCSVEQTCGQDIAEIVFILNFLFCSAVITNYNHKTQKSNSNSMFMVANYAEFACTSPGKSTFAIVDQIAS